MPRETRSGSSEAPDLSSKFQGSMIGSALGDAVGEMAFQYPEERALQSAMDRTAVWRYTDDTAMAIGLAESLEEKGTLDPQHLGEVFRRNFLREPWRGYASGPPTIFSMVERQGISYTEAAQRLFGGQGSLGNGAAMRIAPLGLFFYNDTDLYRHAGTSARVTHAHPVGMDGAAVQALAVAMAVRLDPLDPFPLEKVGNALAGFSRTPEIRGKMELVLRLVSEEASPREAARRIGRSVAVHESMPFAVYAFLSNPHSFEECLFCAIMNGGDRDTLGAMAGAISGAFLGIGAIPTVWRERLENRSHLAGLASGLAKTVAGRDSIV